MRRRAVVVTGVASAMGALALVACVDLFHSTSDILDACQIDAAAEGCAPLAQNDAEIADATSDGFDGNIDLCSFTPTEARANAEAACAWLGACETPLGQNRYATCVEHAILAYDCTANASMTVRGSALDFWKCMVTARDCASVHACAWGVDQPSCPGHSASDTVCDENAAQAPLIERGQCPNDGSTPQPHAENCAAWGQTCSYSTTHDGVAACAGSSTGFGPGGCAAAGCNGTQLSQCDDAGDNVGVDCANYANGQCVTTGGSPTCSSLSTTPCPDGGPVGVVDCTSDFRYAVGCPDGRHQQQIDCNAVTEGAGACTATSSPGWDISRACFNSGATCNFNDKCVGATLSSCDRGVTYTQTCAAPFTGCQLVPTADGDFMRAQCVLP
jgi:hypothetical protein